MAIIRAIIEFFADVIYFKVSDRAPRWYDYLISPVLRWLILIVVIIISFSWIREFYIWLIDYFFYGL